MDNKQMNKETLLEMVKKNQETLMKEAKEAGFDTSNPKAILEHLKERSKNAKPVSTTNVKSSEASQEKMAAFREKIRAMIEAKKQQNNVEKENDK